MTVAQRRAWFAEMAAGPHELYGVWEGEALVGSVSLHDRIGPGALEIGYWVHVAHIRRGVATEMVRRICAIAFAKEGVRHVEIHHDRANLASQRVARSAGFVHVLDRPDPPQGPADEGIERVWRLTR